MHLHKCKCKSLSELMDRDSFSIVDPVVCCERISTFGSPLDIN